MNLIDDETLKMLNVWESSKYHVCSLTNPSYKAFLNHLGIFFNLYFYFGLSQLCYILHFFWNLYIITYNIHTDIDIG